MKPLPDILEIIPPKQPPHATVTVPGSKSITNRALILAALSDKTCTLRGALRADDTEVMVDSLQRLGFEVKVSPDPAEECNRTIEVVGRGGEIPATKAELYVGNAGTAARFLTAFVCLHPNGEYTIRGDARIHQRPMKDLFDCLRRIGMEIRATDDHLPATIRTRAPAVKGAFDEPFREYRVVSTAVSSQFASAVLLVSKHAHWLTYMDVRDEPGGYVAMTRRMLKRFRPDYAIEPDLSSASYFVAMQHLIGGRIEIAGWPRHSLQIDAKFPKFLPPPAMVSRNRDLGDSVMTLPICAAVAGRRFQLVEASRMREQECDRLHALVTELKKVGAKARETESGLVIETTRAPKLHGAEIETYNDHRMAMSFAVLGLKIPGIRIKNPSCVSKTFPNFFDKLKQLGAGLVDVKTGKRL